MADKAFAIIRLLRWLIVLFVLLACLSVLVYSPYYSQGLLWLLNRYVDVSVDPVAAQSQRTGQLNLDAQLEPGSKEWVARRAYLTEVNRTLHEGKGEDFIQLQYRYQLLLDMIREQESTDQDSKSVSSIKRLNKQDADFYQHVVGEEHEPLLQTYREFLQKTDLMIDLPVPSYEQLPHQPLKENQSPLILSRLAHQPHAIVILGGGLTTGEQKDEIVVNGYTKKRLEQALMLYRQQALPIVLSGVEAPYMQRWLEQHGVQAQFLENKSMNTCENTRFSSLLLQKQGGAPTVYLVTDAYHMPRSQRLFARNGISTIPIIAALPNPLTEWQPDQKNLMHSRRATYEVLATMRDVWLGESNCREIP